MFGIVAFVIVYFSYGEDMVVADDHCKSKKCNTFAMLITCIILPWRCPDYGMLQKCVEAMGILPG